MKAVVDLRFTDEQFWKMAPRKLFILIKEKKRDDRGRMRLQALIMWGKEPADPDDWEVPDDYDPLEDWD